jgi:hypothetical protein
MTNLRQQFLDIPIAQKTVQFRDNLTDYSNTFPQTKIEFTVKVKLSRHTPWRSLGGGKVQLLLVLDLGTALG